MTIENDEFKREGADPFAALETDTPSESLPEKEPEVAKPVEGETVEVPSTPEENIPFHKDPRWIKREEELSSLRERDEINAREIAELKAFKEESTKQAESTPEWFKELYGDNPSAYQKYLEHENRRTDEIKKGILEDQERKVQSEKEEVQKWEKWREDSYLALEAEGLKFDRNKLGKILLDYAPTDEKGNIDFKKGYRIYEALEAKEPAVNSTARKQIADTTTVSPKGEAQKKNYMTADDLRGKSWNMIA